MKVNKGNKHNRYIEFEVDSLVEVHDVDSSYQEYVDSCYGDCYLCGLFGGAECLNGNVVEFQWSELRCWNVDEILEGKRG